MRHESSDQKDNETLLIETHERVKMLNDWHNEVNAWRSKIDVELATIRETLVWIKWLAILIAGVVITEVIKEWYFP